MCAWIFAIDFVSIGCHSCHTKATLACVCLRPALYPYLSLSLSLPMPSLFPTLAVFTIFPDQGGRQLFLRLILNCLPRIHQWRKKGEKIKAVIWKMHNKWAWLPNRRKRRRQWAWQRQFKHAFKLYRLATFPALHIDWFLSLFLYTIVIAKAFNYLGGVTLTEIELF